MTVSADLKSLVKVTRPEFVPANSASLLIGIAWALPAPFITVVISALLGFVIISLVAAFAAQINTLSDYPCDRRDQTKKELVTALESLNERKVRVAMIAELISSLIFLGALCSYTGKISLVLFWIFGVIFAYGYSAPPLRFKSRSWLSMVVLMLVLSVIPISFVYYSISSTFQPFFAVFLIGQALTVYAIIIPAEIRDYFIDRAMEISTLTVSLGLKRAILLAIALLSMGGILCSLGFFFDVLARRQLWLALFLLVPAFLYGMVMLRYIQLRILTHRYYSERTDSLRTEIVSLAAHNPAWITLVSQSIVLLCIILLLSKTVL